ncbi:TonB-dependent receptor [Shewanella corallii]|uniref:TonB-dependent receptor n=1 Tax=Shewanella corallii TaxID=560080 RepID=A0ABT0N4Z5_9GAMM|nr:TonB-dependent receptor [Shewanella corallii]MCL2913472.1 TonB-dependent receptor [Shewanella corallii]
MKSDISKVSSAAKHVATAVSGTLLCMTNVVFAEEQPERIEVTGSRIKQDSSLMSTPTTVIDADAIAQTGVTNIGELMNTLPALVAGITSTINNSTSSSFNPNNAGLELANLRGLGTNRTLVLVDGRRHVASSAGTAAVDMSSIPAPLIERIEVITGGASAIYGSDAVTGVVNFIMKKEFEGFQVNARYGQTSQSDGKEKDMSITWGTDFADTKGNLMAYVGYSDSEEIPLTARSYTNVNPSFRPNPMNTGPNDGIPDNLYFADARFQALSSEGLFYVPNENYFFDGIFEIADAPVPTFADDPIPFPFGRVGYDTYAIDRDTGNFRDFVGGKNCQVVPCDGGDGFRTNETGTLKTPSERLQFYLSGNYQITENHQLFSEAKYNKTESFVSGQASVFHDDNFGPLIKITKDNPFRPQALVDLMTERNLNSVALAVVGLPARNHNTRETTQFTVGAEGFFSDFEYNSYVQHGQVKGELISSDLLNERYYRALDAVADASGNAVCRDQSDPACVAYNPINRLASDEAKAYVGVDLKTEEEIAQTIASFVISGSLFDNASIPVNFASGIEYRYESSESTPDALTQAIDPDGIGSGLVGSMTGPSREENSFQRPTEGSYHATDVFTELQMDLLGDLPGMDNLSLELAARYSKHSIVGGDLSYKTGINWAVFDDLTLRSTYSKAVRAPNISELFQPETIGGTRMTDPCHFTRNNDVPNRLANCQALGLPADFDSIKAEAGTRRVLSKGNTDLKSEEAYTTTVGIAYRPSNHLTMAVDYWDIDIEDAITTFDVNDILSNCVDGAQLNQEFCKFIERDNEKQISLVSTQNINAAKFRATGVDFEFNYLLDFEQAGEVKLGLTSSYVDRYEFQNNSEDPSDIDSLAGDLGRPRVRGNLNINYRLNDFTANWRAVYVGETYFNKTFANQPEYAPEGFENKVDAVTYHNLQLSYSLMDQYRLYAGVDNIFDKEPQLLPGVATGQILYDNLGRRFYAGVNLKF